MLEGEVGLGLLFPWPFFCFLFLFFSLGGVESEMKLGMVLGFVGEGREVGEGGEGWW